MPRVLCVWLPNWSVQRAMRIQPELRGRPVALVTSGRSTAGPAGSNKPRTVAACCAQAIAQGVRPAMSLAEAQALAPDLQIVLYDPAKDRRALMKLAEACEQFSPRVAIEEGDEPESLLLDISNLAHLYGSEACLIRNVEQFFTRCSYRIRLAAAETVGAAWAAAHCARYSNDKFQMTNEETMHSSFPIESLRITDATAALLRELGIETVNQLLALPRDELTLRFGEELLRRLDQLTGRGRELIEPHRGFPAFAASCVLDEPTGDRNLLMHMLAQLVDQLSQQLAARNEGAVLLSCLLRVAGGGTTGVGDGRDETPPTPPPFAESQDMPPHVLRIGLLEPSANPRQILELIELHLESMRLADEVDRIELRAVVTGRLGERQRELFTDRRTSNPHQLVVLVNRLSSRLGSDRVLRAELRKSPVPERAVGWMPATERATKKLQNAKSAKRSPKWQTVRESRKRPASAINNLQSPRPLMLHPIPKAVEVVCIAPDGPPQFLWRGQQRERIIGCVGPERIETLWWRGPSVRRDYYRIAMESGAHLWMFRRLTDGRWFTHGEFD